MNLEDKDELRSCWQSLSVKNKWRLVCDIESFLQSATDEMEKLVDIRSLEQRKKMALTRAYSVLLYEGCQRKDVEAVTEVWLAVYRLALRDRLDQGEAEVVAQDAIVRMLEQISSLSSPASFIFWIMRIYNTSRSRLASKGREVLSVEDMGDEDLYYIDDNIELVEERVILQKLFDVIRKVVRNNLEMIALVRCVFGGDSPHDVASELGVYPARIRVAKSRALHRLRSDTRFMAFSEQLMGDIKLKDGMF